MHLEAEDLNETGKLCVATIADVLNDRVRVHFDGWDDCYDYWVDTSSPYIHPCGWHEGRQKLVPPPGYAAASFTWTDYLRRSKGLPAPAEFFVAREPIDFKPNMKLEVVDPRIPYLIRPGTVLARKSHRIKIHLDLWPSMYCFWLEDDSPDVHPIGWCDATGHELEPPPGYKVRSIRGGVHLVGCRNIGNAKSSKLNTHHAIEFCPYAPQNWRHKPQRDRRVDGNQITTGDLSRSPSPMSTDKSYKPERIKRTSSPTFKTTFKNRQCETKATLPLLSVIKTEANDDEAYVPKTKVDILPDSSLCSNSYSASDKTCDAAINVAKEFLCDYGPRLQQNYEIWRRHMAAINANLPPIVQNPLSWSASEVAAFVKRVLKSNEIAEHFLREDIDGSALLQMQQSDFSDLMDLPLGPALKLYTQVLQLRTAYICKFKAET